MCFTDAGQGFAGDAGRLGSLFYRGQRSQGAGVGLYLIRMLMQRMGGRAEFASRSRRGLRDTAALSARRGDAVSAPARILVVEDEPNVGRTLTERLTTEGYQVTWARVAGRGRWPRIRRVAGDLALLDVGIARWLRLRPCGGPAAPASADRDRIS